MYVLYMCIYENESFAKQRTILYYSFFPVFSTYLSTKSDLPNKRSLVVDMA